MEAKTKIKEILQHQRAFLALLDFVINRTT